MKRRKPPCPAAPPPHKEWGVKNIQLHRPWLAREKFMPPNSGAVGTLLSSTVKGTNAQRKRRTVLESFASSTLLSSFDDQEDDSAFLGRGWHLGIKVTVESRQVFRLPAQWVNSDSATSSFSKVELKFSICKGSPTTGEKLGPGTGEPSLISSKGGV